MIVREDDTLVCEACYAEEPPEPPDLPQHRWAFATLAPLAARGRPVRVVRRPPDNAPSIARASHGEVPRNARGAGKP